MSGRVWLERPGDPEACQWFRRHGIDPNAVAVAPGWVEIDDQARQIRYLAYEFDAAGHIVIAGADAVRFVATQQLESPPLPPPEWATVGWLDGDGQLP